MKKLMMVALLFSSVFANASFFENFTKEEIREQYEFFLDHIVYRYDMVVNDDYFYVCNSWRMSVLLAKELNHDTKVDDINLIVLVDILNNHDYSSEVKKGIHAKLSYFQNDCQPIEYPIS